ncbi:helix-turn-helix domain-containing protein [Sinomonas sp. B1-1]|uniref:helix-turn-helix domain-containing protein n=1 Tax=Sinomonas sp. B1-1 TaxID=3141454 RepID=UPI003D297E12
MSTSQPSPYLTRAQAAEYLNVKPRWLANEGRGLVPFHRFGSMVRYHLETLEQWARQQRVRTA